MIERPLKGRVTVEARDAALLFFVVTCFVLAHVLAPPTIARFELSVFFTTYIIAADNTIVDSASTLFFHATSTPCMASTTDSRND